MKKTSVLLKTSSATDVMESGNTVTITGLTPIAKNQITNIRQFKYHAEVVQVLTFTTSSETPLANTTYSLELANPNTRKYGYTQNTKTFAYTTPADLTTIGANAAAQREAINLQIIAAINAQTASCYMTAATSGGGAGIVITDNAGYYPPRLISATGGRKGASLVRIATGFTGSTMTVTTAPVYQFGDGTWLSQDAPIYAAYFQNYISGEIQTPLTNANPGVPATAGQFYDAFTITSYVIAQSSVGIQGQLCLMEQNQTVFVDNGTGSSTSNAAGYAAFERAMLQLLSNVYSNTSSTIEWFDKNVLWQGGLLGQLPLTTASTNNSLAVYTKMISPYGLLEQRNIGTQTIVTGAIGAGGFNMDQDLTNNDGAHYSPSLYSYNTQQFVVGACEFSVMCKMAITTITATNFQVGFHEKNVFFADWNDYVNLASIGTDATAGAITTRGILANAATVSTVSATPIVTAVINDFVIKVDINGYVTAYANNIAYPIYSAGTTQLKFAAGTIMVPFINNVNTGAAATATASALIALPTASWRI